MPPARLDVEPDALHRVVSPRGGVEIAPARRPTRVRHAAGVPAQDRDPLPRRLVVDPHGLVVRPRGEERVRGPERGRREAREKACVGEAIGQSNVLPVKR
eukprot:31373-Pelagococcus_subviridis.AAC.12